MRFAADTPQQLVAFWLGGPSGLFFEALSNPQTSRATLEGARKILLASGRRGGRRAAHIIDRELARRARAMTVLARLCLAVLVAKPRQWLVTEQIAAHLGLEDPWPHNIFDLPPLGLVERAVKALWHRDDLPLGRLAWGLTRHKRKRWRWWSIEQLPAGRPRVSSWTPATRDAGDGQPKMALARLAAVQRRLLDNVAAINRGPSLVRVALTMLGSRIQPYPPAVALRRAVEFDDPIAKGQLASIAADLASRASESICQRCGKRSELAVPGLCPACREQLH